MSMLSFSDYHLAINTIQNYYQHGYSGITLLYVAKGSIHIQSEEEEAKLQSNDVYLINNQIDYQINSSEDNIVIQLAISNSYISHYYPYHLSNYYRLSSIEQSDFKKVYIEHLSISLAKMVLSHLKKGENSQLECNYFLTKILFILVSFFKEKNLTNYRKNSAYSPRIEKIVDAINHRYNEVLSLQKMAAQEHVSFAHLSRLFKKEVGIGFIQYVNGIRFEHAINALINTSKPIYQIAEENGFTNTKQFIEAFKNKFKQTPNQFRLLYKSGRAPSLFVKDSFENKEQSGIHDVNPSEVIYLLSNLAYNYSSNNQELSLEQFTHTEEQLIDLNYHDKPLEITKPNYIITIGELSELMIDINRQQLLQLKQTVPISYVETYHLISGNTILPEFMTDEPTPTSTPYNHSDVALSFLYKNQISLFVRIYHDNVKQNIDHYLEKTYKFLQHCIYLYGYEYISSWRFIYYLENTDNINLHLLTEHFLKIKQTICQLLPDTQLGLFYPFSYLEDMKINPLFQTELIRHIDFLGYSAYFSEMFKSEKLITEPNIHTVHFIEEKTQRLKLALKHHNIKLPLLLMKWNSFTGNTRHTNGSFFRGALLFQELLTLAPKIEHIALTLNTEIQQEAQPDHIDTTGIALFYLHTMKRPIFFVLTLLEKLQGQIIKQTDEYILTKRGNSYQLVLLNIAVFNPYISIQEDLVQGYKRNKLFTIYGIPDGIYQIRRYIFDQNHGALYKKYQQFQTQYGRNQEVIDYLERSTMPDLTVFDEKINYSGWRILANLNVNAIHFYELKQITAISSIE